MTWLEALDGALRADGIDPDAAVLALLCTFFIGCLLAAALFDETPRYRP